VQYWYFYIKKTILICHGFILSNESTGEYMKYTVVSKNIVNISHLEMLLSYVYFLCEHTDSVSLFVTFSNSIWNKSLVNKDDLSKYKLPHNLEVLSEEFDIYASKDTVQICNFGYLGVRNWLDSKKYHHFHSFVQMDEGSGSWQNFFTLLMIGVEEQQNKNKPVVSYVLKKLASKIIGMLQRSKIVKWTWLKDTTINKDLVNYLPKVYASKKKKEEMLFIKEETWIILTGGYVESGYLSESTYLQWLTEIIDTIKTDRNHVLLKCHPAEDLSKYDAISDKVNILEVSNSIESLFCDEKYHEYKVIGEHSTSLVTLNILYGITTYFVKSLVHRKITGDFKKLFDAHVKKLEVSEL